MGITAHSAVYCFGLYAPPGATVRIMCVSSMNLGPLTWRRSFFTGSGLPSALAASISHCGIVHRLLDPVRGSVAIAC